MSWVDGESMGFIDEGSGNFTFRTTDLVVDEVPLYELARRGPDGAPASLGAPRVMGSGPPFARRPADAPGGRPRFGAYSRIYFAVVPAAAGAFDPDASPDAVALLTAQAIDPQAYRGRVATDVACFAATDFPAGCTWLDSQARIEDSLGVVNILRHRGHGMYAAGVLRRQGDLGSMSRSRARYPRLTLLLAALGRCAAAMSGQARAAEAPPPDVAAVAPTPAEPKSDTDDDNDDETETEGFVLPSRHPDRAAADADGLRRLRLRRRRRQRHQLSARRQPRARRLRRRYLRHRRQFARRRRFDRLRRPRDQRLPAAVGEHRRAAVVPAQRRQPGPALPGAHTCR